MKPRVIAGYGVGALGVPKPRRRVLPRNANLDDRSSIHAFHQVATGSFTPGEVVALLRILGR
jgi:hypothetical protein